MLLEEMNIFYQVVEQQSFSKAAERLNVSKSYVSKKIAFLEKELSVKLLLRHSRKLTVTEVGKCFYNHCANIVNESEKAYSMIESLKGEPQGLLKVSIPPALGLELMSPIFTKFMAQYPNVILDIHLESGLIDLVKGGYDLALRSAKLASSNLIAQRVFEVKQIICATDSYLQSRDPIETPEHLRQHIFATYNQAKSAKQLILHKKRKKYCVDIKSHLQANSTNFIRQLVLNSACMAVLPEFMVDKAIQSKQLTQCLPEYTLPKSPLYAIYPERQFMLPSLKCLLDMIKKQFKAYQ